MNSPSNQSPPLPRLAEHLSIVQRDITNPEPLHVHAQEIAVAAEFSESRRAEFLNGRTAIRQALLLSGHPHPSPIHRGDNRTTPPQFDPSNKGLVSLSHSGVWACAVAVPEQFRHEYIGIGNDIEDLSKKRRDISERILTQDEIDLKLDWRVISSAKEAIYKALRPTINAYFGMKTVSLAPVENKEGQYTITDADPVITNIIDVASVIIDTAQTGQWISSICLLEN